MEINCAYKKITKKENRKTILMAIDQPMTAKQISKRTGLNSVICCKALKNFVLDGLVVCLNPAAHNSRLYWLTDIGKECQKRLSLKLNLPQKDYDFPEVDWSLYGWTCYNHRAAIIRILTEPMQPSEIKRTLRRHRSSIKISANNIRDVVKLLLEKQIVQKVHVRKKAHPRYELTDSGKRFQELLMQSEMTF